MVVLAENFHIRSPPYPLRYLKSSRDFRGGLVLQWPGPGVYGISLVWLSGVSRLSFEGQAYA